MVKIAWQPLPGSQELALACECNEILLCGTRGTGKSEVQLAMFRKNVGRGFGPAYKGIIIDQEYKALDDLIKKSKKMFPAFKDGARFLSSASSLKWIWPTGEELLFRAIENSNDYDNLHGHEAAYIGINELTKYPDDEVYMLLRSINRTTPFNGKMPNLQIVSTTNPWGAGRTWVKKRFIDGVGYGQIQKEITVVDGEEIVRTRVALYSHFSENHLLPKTYVANILQDTNEGRRKAWAFGSWDYSVGGALDDLLSKTTHSFKRLRIPATWQVSRSFDWGSSHPFAVVWIAESDGQNPAICAETGDEKLFKKGDLLVVRELYGAKDISKNEGLGLSPTDIAREILLVENDMRETGIITGRIYPGESDSQIFSTVQSDVLTIASQMQKVGVSFLPADKAKGSRKTGLAMFRERLENSLKQRENGLYISADCIATWETLLSLQRCKKILDDVDTTGRDHIYDAIRYRILRNKSKIITKKVPVSFA